MDMTENVTELRNVKEIDKSKNTLGYPNKEEFTPSKIQKIKEVSQPEECLTQEAHEEVKKDPTEQCIFSGYGVDKFCYNWAGTRDGSHCKSLSYACFSSGASENQGVCEYIRQSLMSVGGRIEKLITKKGLTKQEFSKGLSDMVNELNKVSKTKYKVKGE